MKMNQNGEEMKCQICEKTIRSDATIYEYCKLCYMVIVEPSDFPKMQTNEGLCTIIYANNCFAH